MKKILTLLLVLTGFVCSASAADDIYLRTDYKGTNVWGEDNGDYKFTFVERNGSDEDVYTYTINAADIQSQDVWFRLHISGWGEQICPYTSDGSYTYVFSNGQNETYGAKYERTYFQGSNYSFGISHSTIKASQYKITLFRGNNEQNYENENCKVMWIKVEIVSMPLTISASQGTFSSDRALDFSGTGISAYAITTADDGELTKSSELTTVPANTGLFVEGANGTYNIPVIETSNASSIETNMLVAGTGEEINQTDGDKTNFILTVNKADGTTADAPKFFKVNKAGNTVPAGKAYLQIPTATVGAREFFWFDDDVTAINAVENNQKTDGQAYNLAGQRIAQPTKGLYIVNGRKVVIR